ncbi:MAG: glycosyltransferase family 9 protein [Flavobacteriia bacterium]
MKILIIRFSSIGDIVLTTPVVRALKMQLRDVEIHYLTKQTFKAILENNPYIDRLFYIKNDIREVITDLKTEQYDHIVDLHNNIRTLSLKRQLKSPSNSFPKLNLEKWLLVNFKWNRLPEKHVVDRYFEAVNALGVKNDHFPCEFYLSTDDHVDIRNEFGLAPRQFISIAIGAQFGTKRMPFHKLIEIIELTEFPIILVGGVTDVEIAQQITNHFTDKKAVFSACGKYSLGKSASIVKQSACLLSNDTGMMHIAACFGLPVVSVWGNTVPALGMFPYYPGQLELYSIHEVEGLKCRPCSKIGFQECPKKHFDCMNLQNTSKIAADLNARVGLILEE